MKRLHYSKTISLVELILVLTIMVLFAGIAVNTYPDISRKSKLITNYQNMLKVYNASVAFEAENQGAIPAGMDSLIKVSGPFFDLATGGTLGFGFVTVGGTLADIAIVLGGLLTPNELYSQLNTYNLFEVFTIPDSSNPHFTLDPQLSLFSLDPSTPPLQPLVYIDPETIALNRVREMLGDPNYTPPSNDTVLLCFGIGLKSELLDRSNSGLSIPPVYFPDRGIDGGLSRSRIQSTYCRYINIYEVQVTSELKLLIRFLTTVRPNELTTTGISPFTSMASDFEKLNKEFNQ